MDYYWTITITGLLLDHDFLVYLLIGSSLDYIGFMMMFKVFLQRLGQADASTDQGTVQRLSSQRPESRLWTKR